MYRINLFIPLFNKIIVYMIIFSLLSVSFSFNIHENIKQELNDLYKATSVCEYYNTITNFSYGIINKILESTNIVLTNSTKNNNERKENNTKRVNYLDFVQPKNEHNIKNFKSINNNFINKLLYCFNENNYFQKSILIKYIYNSKTFMLMFYKFYYYARGNIEDIINFNNIKKTHKRLV